MFVEDDEGCVYILISGTYMSLTRLRKQDLRTKGWGEGRCQTCNSKCSGRHFAAAYMQSFGDHNYGGKAMPGFLGVVSRAKKLDIEKLKNMKIEYLSNASIIEDQMTSDRFFLNFRALKKFEEDKLFCQRGGKFYCLDGVIINRKELLNKYAGKDLADVMERRGFEELVGEMRGEFAGFVLDMQERKLILATDHISSKPVFYALIDGYFVFGTEYRYVIQLMKELKLPLKLSEVGVLALLEFGYMLEDSTLLKDVWKLRAGNFLTLDFDRFTFVTEEYFSPRVEPKLEDKTLILRQLNDTFSQAVRMEWEKDLEYGYSHLATLSGGLDSRTNVLMAKKLGFKNISVITFSESDYWDERIAKKISRENGFNFLFRALDNGNYLIDVGKYVKANGGLIKYNGSAHLFSTLESLNTQKFGILHTGQLGDAVLGNYLGKDLRSKKLEEFLDEAKKSYENQEKFILYNRGYNAILNGNWNAQHFTEAISPFLFPEFLGLCLRIPNRYKRHEAIYREWLRTYLPEAYRYPWEAFRGLKPSMPGWMAWLKKAYYGGTKRVFGQKRWHSMNPMDYWWKTNEKLRKAIEDYIKSYLPSTSREVKDKLRENLESSSFDVRARALTLLAFVNLFLSSEQGV